MFDCRSDDIALYVGRGTGFTDFLNHVFNTCPAIAKPTVIGDDAITRFVAQGKAAGPTTSRDQRGRVVRSIWTVSPNQ